MAGDTKNKETHATGYATSYDYTRALLGTIGSSSMLRPLAEMLGRLLDDPLLREQLEKVPPVEANTLPAKSIH